MKSQYTWPNAKIGSDEKLTTLTLNQNLIIMIILQWKFWNDIYKWTLAISWDICILFTQQWQDIKISSYM